MASKTQQITESNITEGSCEVAEREKGERKLSQKQERTDSHTRKTEKKGLRKSECKQGSGGQRELVCKDSQAVNIHLFSKRSWLVLFFSLFTIPAWAIIGATLS